MTSKRNYIVAYLIREVNPLPDALKFTNEERKAVGEKIRAQADDNLFRERMPLIDNHVFQLMSAGKLTKKEEAAVYFLQDFIATSKLTLLREWRWTDEEYHPPPFFNTSRLYFH